MPRVTRAALRAGMVETEVHEEVQKVPLNDTLTPSLETEETDTTTESPKKPQPVRRTRSTRSRKALEEVTGNESASSAPDATEATKPIEADISPSEGPEDGEVDDTMQLRRSTRSAATAAPKRGRSRKNKKKGEEVVEQSCAETSVGTAEHPCADEHVIAEAEAMGSEREEHSEEEAISQERLETDQPSPLESLLEQTAQTPEAQPVQRRPNTPRFDPEIHVEVSAAASPMAVDENSEQSEDSFVQAITSRSPSKPSLNVETTTAISPSKSPRSVARPMSMMSTRSAMLSDYSPGKQSRIEDTVDQLDALEDALEEFGQDLSQIAENNGLTSPTLAISKLKIGDMSYTKATLKPAVATPPAAAAAGQKTPARNVAAPRTTTKPGVSHTKPLVKPRATSASATSRPAKPAVEKNSSSKTPSKVAAPVAPKAKTRPISALVKTPFVPARSAKPTTTASFELPGEAIARKLKAQREERKAREEERAKNAASNPRPVAKPTTSQQGTARSTFRSSVYGSNSSSTTAPKPIAPPPSTLKPQVPRQRPVSVMAMPTNSEFSTARPALKRQASTSTFSSARTTSFSNSIKSMSSASRTSSMTSTAPSITITNVSKAPCVTAAGPRHLSAQDRFASKQRGKQIFQKDKDEKEDREREKKEKEEAARKAREEAAERGRQASREWAERQRRKMMAMATGGVSA